MPRRRYRLFFVIAAVFLFVLYQTSQRTSWDPYGYTSITKPKAHGNHEHEGHNHEAHAPADAHKQQQQQQQPPQPAKQEADEAKKRPPPQPESHRYADDDEEEGSNGEEAAAPAKAKTVKLPELKTALEKPGTYALPTKAPETADTTENDEESETAVPKKAAVTPAPQKTDIHWKNPPGANKHQPADPKPTTASQIHWHKVHEHFPIDEATLITLPDGKPKPIPAIQHKFETESVADKEKREKRLAEVKQEMRRAWAGYREHAWMHDELSPVSNKFRDPFCGWAASLVDALDTLWIMGMHEEFDEAAKAVANIDFTYSAVRRDIPVFETIIRYLGGLLGAYDVSGAAESRRYPMLLEKAEELAEILMGVFDTPNRMPILYYNWMPEYASQPHRATIVSVAELGTMSMEFTRLTQLTGKQKYYDAIARITNAFEDLQNRGTTLDGIFPEHLDASGCNQTAKNILREEREARAREAQRQVELQSQLIAEENNLPPQGYQPETPIDGENRAGNASEPAIIEKRQVREEEDGKVVSESIPAWVPGSPHEFSEKVPESETTTAWGGPWGPNGEDSEWDCPEQGLVPSSSYESYSMGGSQDSAYEYFPKEYILLGGLEPKYKTMHEKTMAAVKKWLLYRAMVPDEREVLFSAKATTSGHPEKDLHKEYEVTHLTCFLAGTFGLGGKIFGDEEDVEIAKKLADGCVWAYESTASGIMPETATLVPCESMTSCPWNETLWHLHIDPSADWRDKEVADWEKKLAETKAKAATAEKARQAAMKQEKEDEEAARQAEQAIQKAVDEELKVKTAKHKAEWDRHKQNAEMFGEKLETDRNMEADAPPAYPRPEPGTEKEAAKRKVNKRGAPPPMDPAANNNDLESKLDLNHGSDAGSDSGSSSGAGSAAPGIAAGTTGGQPEYGLKVEGGVASQIPLEMPAKPLSHKEWVENQIKKEGIPKGFVSVQSKAYILRPEAIEAVWYMHRITGDPIWMEKGWKMWKAVMAATRTETAHSAIDSVLEAKTRQTDQMESFWFAETLKYFYLLYATPDTISLDDWVLNTEAHPFKRPT